MFNKKIILMLTIILGSLFAISAVSAASDNATNDVISIEETTTDAISVEEAKEVVSVEDNQVISEEEDNFGNFTELSNLIKDTPEGATLELDKNYKYVDDLKYGIKINKSIVIDGGQHTIEANDLNVMFELDSDSIILKNINFKLGTTRPYDYYGGYFIKANYINNLNIINCNFEGHSDYVLQLYETNNTYIENCNFSLDSIEFGEVIRINGGNNNLINNCNFDNIDTYIMRISGNNHKIQGCKFINSHNGWDDCLISLTMRYVEKYIEDEYGNGYYEYFEVEPSNCTINDCLFYNLRGDSIISSIGDFKIDNCTFIKNDGHLIELRGNEIINNCTFIDLNNNGLSSILIYGDGNIINNCKFINSTVYDNDGRTNGNGGSIFERGTNVRITNNIFINSTSTNKGGAIYSMGNNITINNNTFINNNAPAGKSIFIINGTIINNYFNSDEDEISALRNVEIIKKMPTLTLNDIVFNYNNATNCNISLKYDNAPLTNKKIILEIFANDYHINYDLITNEEGIVNIYNLIKNLGIGTWNIKATYLGSSNYESISKSAKITIDQISPIDSIENILNILNVLNDTVQSQSVLISELNDTVVSQENSISMLNGTVQSQSVLISELNDTVVSYENTISLLNNTVQSQSVKIDELNNTVLFQANLIDELDDTVEDMNKTVISQENIIHQLNNTVLSQANLIIELDEKIKNQTNLIEILNAWANNITQMIIEINNTKALIKDTAIISSSVTAVYNDDDYLSLTLVDEEYRTLIGAPISVSFDGKITQYTTDQNGQVKIPTKYLDPKTYPVSIKFDGNKVYASSSKNVEVIIKKATPVLTAAKKTFKANQKTKSYTITLKDNKNKAIGNEKVTIKVDGKTYTATTNSNGQATFKITKLTKKGTYTATVNYSGSDYYNAKTVTPKITVK